VTGAPDSPAAPPAGSPRWYAWLFTPRHARDAVALLFQLESELRSIVVAPRDHGVAHLKLHWWRDEIQRLAAGSPRHPLTQALDRAAPQAVAAWPPLTDFLTSLELELAAVAIDDEMELDRFLALADGLARTLVLAVDEQGAGRAETGAEAGRAIRGVQLVAQWSGTAMDEPRKSAVLHLAGQSRARWHRAAAAMSGSDTLRGLRVFGELHMALLARMERGQFRPGIGRRDLPPLRGLWTAWHAARQH